VLAFDFPLIKEHSNHSLDNGWSKAFMAFVASDPLNDNKNVHVSEDAPKQ
jgi:hypothetical protein